MTLVTAAITTYDRARFLPEAVESVLAQTYPNVELIVVDDGSTDETQSVLEPFLDRITFVRQEHAGRAEARNAAITRARGEYLAFLDSDDLWFSDKLERQVAVLEQRPEVGMAFGHVEMIDQDGLVVADANEEHRHAFERQARQPVTYASWARRCLCFTSTTLFRRSVFEQIGLYDGSATVEDLDLYLRLVRDFEVVFVDGSPLARYRLHSGQTPIGERARGEIAVSLKHLGLLSTENRLARRNFHLRLVENYNLLAETGATRRHALRALGLDPSLVLSPRLLKRLALALLPRQALVNLRASRGRAALER